MSPYIPAEAPMIGAPGEKTKLSATPPIPQRKKYLRNSEDPHRFSSDGPKK